jgi:hypothetical protein
MNKNCINCNQPINDQPENGGRYKDYCSVSCRRMAEREILRIEKRISDLEERLVDLRTMKPDAMLANGRVHEVIRLVEAELKNQNARFKHLLSADKTA